MKNNSIYGAIIGDIAGSFAEVSEIEALKRKSKVPYEDRIKILNPKKPLFTDDCSLTDDSVLTIALMDSLLCDNDYESKLKEYTKRELGLGVDKYGRNRFGKNFVTWALGDGIGDSFGNGCAMRVSPIGYAFDTLSETLYQAELATIPSHNHNDSIMCAKATAGAIFLARHNKNKTEIKRFIEETLNVKLNYDIYELQKNSTFSALAMPTVPIALYCFLQSNSFENCVRLSISVGGDTDTISAIASSVAGAYYGIDDRIITEAKKFINKDYQDIINAFENKFILKNNDKIIDTSVNFDKICK